MVRRCCNFTIGILLATLPASGFARQVTQPINGLVRQIQDSLPIAGAEVMIGPRVTTTNAAGRFRVDSMPAGTYPITIRKIGYRPVRSRIAVVESEPTEAEYYMLPAPLLLPPVIVEATRKGVYGSVGDTAFKAIVGARVEVLGYRGGVAMTDAQGRFAFPEADRGTYVVWITHLAYEERRLLLEVPQGEGRELAVRLGHAFVRRLHSEASALYELGRRLATRFRRERMTESELTRYGSMSLCDVPRVRSVTRDQPQALLNGIIMLRSTQVCAVRMNELSLIEFIEGGIRRTSRGPVRPAGYLIIWEKM